MKFSIVTPSFQGARFLRDVLESVLNQSGNFDLQYHVQDGGSTDETRNILEETESRVRSGAYSHLRRSTSFTWISERDSGMYDAINRGFERTDGDICAWINSDDLYYPDAFRVMQQAFLQFPEISWLKGVTDYLDESGAVTIAGQCYLYNRDWIRNGTYGNEAYFIEQDSVFWRRSLWERCGPIQPLLKLAGDFDLWHKFSKDETLYSLNQRVSAFRKVPGQLSQNLEKYRGEMAQICGGNRKRYSNIELFFKIARRLPDSLGQMAYRNFFGQECRLIDANAGHLNLVATKNFIYPV